MRIHRVREGEGLGDIAREYGISPIKLCENNGRAMRERLITGEELLIIIPTKTVSARRTDTVESLAERYSVKGDYLLAMNPELMGRGILYEGQPISVKHEPQLYGLGIGNGYFYRGCSSDALVRAMPYLNFVTVAAAVARGDGVSMLFDDTEIVRLVRAAAKIPILRVWLGEVGEGQLMDAVKSAALLAKCRGYAGICLGGMREEIKRKEYTLTARRELIECELKLFVECDVEGPREYTEYADGCVLTYDKIHRESVPRFEGGEGEVLRAFAESHDSLRAFVDLSPFALTGDKYIPKEVARSAVARGKGRLEMIADGDCVCAYVGRGCRERRYVWESMQNTKKKLEAVSELGYYGISFDIARVPIYELLMFRCMFSSGISVC